MALNGNPEVYRSFRVADTSILPLAAKILAERVPGVKIDPNPSKQTPEGFTKFPRVLDGDFDLLADQNARRIVDRVMNAQEVCFLDNILTLPYFVNQDFYDDFASRYIQEEPGLPLIPDALKRVEIVKLQKAAQGYRIRAYNQSRFDPVESNKYTIRALFADARAEMLSQFLIPTKNIINQVIDREIAYVENNPSKKSPIDNLNPYIAASPQNLN